MAKFETIDEKLFIDGKKVIAGWESYTGWFWFATEITETRNVGIGDGGSVIDGIEMNDTIYFGFIQGIEEEWGYFSLAELQSLPGKVWRIKKIDLPSAGRRPKPRRSS